MPAEKVEHLPVKRELASGASIRPIIPTTMEDAFRIATAVVKSGLAPRDMATPEKCLVAIMHGMEVGMAPMQSLQRIAVINGRPTIWGDAAMGLVRASGLCEWVKEWVDGEGDDMVAHCHAKRKGEPEPVESAFGVADARVAGLWGKTGRDGQPTPWVTHPRRMLQMRARGFCLRDGFADVLGGMYLREELEGIDAVDITPEAEPPKTVQAVLDVFKPKIEVAEPKAKPKRAETPLKYDSALSAKNLEVLMASLDEPMTGADLDDFVESHREVAHRLTPEDQNALEKKLTERALEILHDDQEERPTFFKGD